MSTERISFYIEELSAETPATRKCLERIPESTYAFKPHPKSMEMGYLALLVADIPRWITHIIEHGEINFANYKQFELSNTKALLDHFDENIKNATTTLKQATTASLTGDFTLKNGEQVLFASPKTETLASTLNHWVHHRGQLTVYMRLNEIAVPSIYGPSADEKGF